MRKLLSLLVIALFFIGMIPSGNIPLLGSNTQAAPVNKKGTMIALRFYPVHSTKEYKVIGCSEANFAFCGSDTCEDTRSFPWEKRGTNFWGRYAPGDPANSYLMPYAGNSPVGDRYDMQGKLWKCMLLDATYAPTLVRGEPLSSIRGQGIWDIQTKHATVQFVIIDVNNVGDPANLTLKTLISSGR